MKKLLLPLLLLFAFVADAQISKKHQMVYHVSVQGGGGAPADDPANIVHTTVDIAASSPANVFIYEPVGLNNMAEAPVLIFYGGDGTDNNATTVVTGTALSSGDTFTWTATLANSGSNRVISTSVIIYDDGVEIARGDIGGQIRGDEVDVGSVGLTSASSALTITSNVALSGSITVNYTYSTMFLEGIPLTMNQGDNFDDRGLVVAVQSRSNDVDLGAGYFDEVIEYLWNNYTIDPDRINVSGLSRGARQIGRAAQNMSISNHYAFWINETTGVLSYTDLGAGYVASGYASVSLSTTDIGGTYGTITNYDGIGFVGVQGSADATLVNAMPSWAATWGAGTTLTEYPYMLNLFGVGHSATVWHTNFYYRKYGSVGGGTAPWDYIDFHWKYSRNDEDCATLFVEQAEKRREDAEIDIIDYREALRKVNSLGASATKTALLARLATLKSTLDSEIVWRAIINHTNASITATGNITNMTTHVDNARVDDIIDDNGNTLTGVDFFIGNNPLTSAYESEFSSSRGYHNVAGFDRNVNRAGMRIGASVCPVGFVVPSGTYTLRIYHNETSGTFSQIELTATIGGVAKTGYSQYNRMIGYLEWTGLTETDLANFDLGRNIGDTYVTAMELIRVN